jgi:hypothetical protein
MRSAPPVAVMLRVGPAWRVAALLLAGLTLATGVGWAGLKGGAAWLLPLLSLTLLCCGLWPLRRQPPQRLRWDGHGWWLRPAEGDDECAGVPVVALDLGAHLLLRFDAAATPSRRARRHWLAASRQACAGDWHGLRCALHSSSPARAEPAGTDPLP